MGNTEFRVKRADNNDWAYVLQGQIYHFEAINKTIGLYSSFNDANGQKIFSGDIVSFNRDYNYVVKFDKGAFYLYHTKQKTFDGEPYCWGLLSRAFEPDMKTLGDLKIVGNEFDNPELMKDY
jgi:hypothetical protein